MLKIYIHTCFQALREMDSRVGYQHNVHLKGDVKMTHSNSKLSQAVRAVVLMMGLSSTAALAGMHGGMDQAERAS